MLNGKFSKLAFRELVVVKLVFGILVCLCIGPIPYLIAHQLLVFLLWKKVKKERKVEGRKKKKEE